MKAAIAVFAALLSITLLISWLDKPGEVTGHMYYSE